MFCEQHKKELTDAALGLLSPREESEVRAHLAGCEACRAEFEERRRLVTAIDCEIQAIVAGKPSPEFAARVRQRVEEVRLASTLRWWLVPRWVAAASGALVVLVLLVWFVRREPIVPRNVNPDQAQKAQVARRENGTTQPRPLLERPVKAASAERDRRSLGLGRVRSEPEVLVEAGQEKAIAELYGAVSTGRADPALPLVRPEPIEPAELKIPPLEIAELDLEAKPFDWDRSR